MCSSCEFRAAARQGDWTLAAADSPGAQAMLRLRMAAMLTRILAPGVSVAAEPGAFRLDAGGVALRVGSAADLWAGVAQLADRPFDPLDPGLIGGAASDNAIRDGAA